MRLVAASCRGVSVTTWNATGGAVGTRLPCKGCLGRRCCFSHSAQTVLAAPADEALPRARRLQVEGWDAVTPTRRAGGPGESACVPWRTECAERKAACEKQNSSADRRCSELEPAPLPLKRPNARRRRCALWTMQEADRRALWPRGRTGHGRLAPGRPVAAGVPGATHVQTVPRTTGRPAGARTRQPQVQELSDIAERALSRPPRGPKPRGIARARRWAVRFW